MVREIGSYNPELEGWVKKARTSPSFHEQTVLYDILLDENQLDASLRIQLEIERQELWAQATEQQLKQWAQVEMDKNNAPPFHEDEILEVDPAKQAIDYFADAAERQFQARQKRKK